MSSVFAFLSASREELIELHRALLRQHIIENALRKEQGLELIEPTDLLEKLEHLLHIGADDAHALMHRMEDELWEYSWYTYTDEWAWYRAKQDVLKDLRGAARAKTSDEMDKLVEAQYEKQFEKYVAEVDMQEELPTKAPQTKRARAPKKK